MTNPFLIKLAEPVVFNPRNTKPVRPFVERMVLGRDFTGANEEDAEKIRRMFELMRHARPEALAQTRLFVGRPDPDAVVNQFADTANQDSLIHDMMSTRNAVAQHVGSMTGTGLEQHPSAYYTVGDLAILPESSLGVALHETGHALDFNRPRIGGRFRRDLATLFKPSELSEPLAWGRGINALTEGYSQIGTEGDRPLVQEALEDTYRRRAPALGTYFGGTTGALAGAIGSMAMMAESGFLDKQPGQAFILAMTAAGATGMAGALLGALGGKLWSNRGNAAERWADKKIRKAKPKGK